MYSRCNSTFYMSDNEKAMLAQKQFHLSGNQNSNELNYLLSPDDDKEEKSGDRGDGGDRPPGGGGSS